MRTITAAVLLTIASALPASAQQSGLFDGTWTMDAARSASAAQGQADRVLSATQVISTQDADLTIESVRNGNRQMAHYPMKRPLQSEPVGTAGGSGVGTIVNSENGELTTATPLTVNGKAVTVYERRHLSADGGEMIVETIVRVEHGYEGQGINYSQAVKDIYVKSR